MDWFEPIAAYCERGGPAFWAEPVNALSNLAFLAAAVAALIRERGRGGDPACRALALLVAVVGIGSFLFHTLAVRWAMLADVVPIALFIHAYFWLALVRFLGLGWAAAGVATAAFAAFGFGFVPGLDALLGISLSERTNGSIDYAPALLALVGVAALARAAPADAAARRVPGRLLAIAAVFALSLAFRTLDRTVCASWPLGSHWLWHLLNAVVLYGLIVTALRGPTERRGGG